MFSIAGNVFQIVLPLTCKRHNILFRPLPILLVYSLIFLGPPVRVHQIRYSFFLISHGVFLIIVNKKNSNGLLPIVIYLYYLIIYSILSLRSIPNKKNTDFII